MLQTVRHRGPDDEGTHLDVDIALGARRLAVIDLHAGRQPIANEEETVWVVHNGEIYNFRELRGRLESRGHRFRTASDTEVIVHAYEEYGAGFLDHLDGMFALAVRDATTRTLTLARDRMGEKPLHYYAGPGCFVFGSELRALVAHPEVPRELSFEGLSRFLSYEYVPAPHSILAGLNKLAPGHVLTVSPGGKPRVTAYWDLSFSADASLEEEEWERQLGRQIDASVRRVLVGDVPVGFFLSGGIDSSAIVAAAARLTGGRVRTFSVGFDEPSYDERRFARAVAARYRTEHTEVVFTPTDARGLMDEVGGLLDEQLVDGSFLPLYVLSREARRTVTVALSGDGADELFCGYPTFLAGRAARWLHYLPAWGVRMGARLANRLPPSPRYGSAEFLLKQFFRGLPLGPAVRTQLLLGGLTAPEQSVLFAPAVRRTTGGFDPHEDLAHGMGQPIGAAPLERLIHQHWRYYLAEQNLVTVDRASMACGLEVRAPFLDRPLVDLAGPVGLKLRRWTTKYILKRTLRDDLPSEVVHRRKQGFGVPLGPGCGGR